MTTAEYAIGTLAAAGFAIVLLHLLAGDQVEALLMGIIRSALSLSGA